MSQDQKSTTPPLPADSPNSHSPQPEETTLHQPTRSPSPSPTPEPATNGHAVNDDNAATAVETSVAEPNAQLTEVRNGAHDESRPDGAAVESQLGNSRDSLEDFGWEELQERFAKKMEECEKREEELGKEFKEWLEVFKAWASVTEIHEEERASKRLRTRIAYVQGKEKELENKREHYVKVVEAFERALALLTNTSL